MLIFFVLNIKNNHFKILLVTLLLVLNIENDLNWKLIRTKSIYLYINWF